MFSRLLGVLPAWVYLSTLPFGTTPVLATSLAGISFGTTQQSVLYDLNTATGAAGNPRLVGIRHVVGIACSSRGVLYGLTNSAASVSPGSLLTIDVSTGASQVVGPTGLTAISEGDLAFDPTSGVLYGCYNLISGERQLFTLDVRTGAATIIPTALPGDLSALAFAADGSFYAVETSLGRVLRIDKTTGALLGSQSLSVGLGAVAGMAVDPATGIFYVADGGSGGTDKLYTLDPTTGELTEVGSTGLADGLAGLTFVIPEPAALTLLVLGMSFLAGCRRQRTAA